MNLKLIASLFLFSFSYFLNAQNLEIDYLPLKGVHEWERTMLKAMEILYLDPTNNENTFIRASKIKTVKKFSTEMKRDSSLKKEFVYEIKYNRLGNLISERTINELKTYLYNEAGFLVEIQSKEISNAPLCYIATSTVLKEEKIWTNELIFQKLKEHIFFDRDNEISRIHRYTYLKNDLISKIEHLGSSNQVWRFYTYEYEFYQ